MRASPHSARATSARRGRRTPGVAIGTWLKRRFAERSIVKSVARQIVIVLVACAITYSIGELVGVNVG